MAQADVTNMFKEIGRRGLGIPLMVISLLAMVIIPLPPLLLDLFFTFNISLSLIILLVTIYSMRPMDFAIFPTIILVATLFRLALNVASTRVVLLEGHAGPGAAGDVIQAFGDFVVGGNYAVGIIVFIILIIINFSVVTKGAGRISEVSARFTLDAMPGKQMAIDADLNSGLIDQEQARARRVDVAAEADFYGSMDGASKFVRGDAVAGILITMINIIGGLIVGVGQHDMAFGDAAETYTLLTIGDGLVAQIPSLLLSTAAGIIVTRVSESQNMGEQIVTQLFGNVSVLVITASVIGMMGLIPGMPNLAFLTLAAILGGIAFLSHNKNKAKLVAEEVSMAEQETPKPAESRELSWDDVPPVDVIGLEVGYRLIPLVDKGQGGQLMDRIKGVRRKLSQEMGFLIPPVHIRDNLDLEPNNYRITLMGVTAGEAEVEPDRELAINPGEVHGEIDGIKTVDPAFGLPAVWFEPQQRDHVQSLGYTVVDPNTVIATHLSQLLSAHAHELLGHEEVQSLLDKLGKSAKKLVEDLVPNTVSLGTVLKVLQNLLEEGVPIRDMRTIAETLSQYGQKSQDPVTLTEQVRTALRRLIYQHISGADDEMPVITLDPKLEQILLQSFHVSADETATIEPGLAQNMHGALYEKVQERELAGEPAVLLVTPQLRSGLTKFVRHTITGLSVLSYNEIPDNKQIRIVATVGA
ncbi:MAG: flagellar biosynthesis protein FlhA [Gammaproteobacteria bacterium]|nr:flagellar biosynthesis protein FlhA [Gammaproteobacteria bacterium]